MLFMIFSPVAEIVAIMRSDDPVITVYMSSMISPIMKNTVPDRREYGVRVETFCSSFIIFSSLGT